MISRARTVIMSVLLLFAGNRREAGQGLAEYALAAALLAVVAIAGVALLGYSVDAWRHAMELQLNR